MRKTIWFLAAALMAGGAACNKTDSEKAATEVRKAKEAVDDEAKDLRKQVEDVKTEVKDVVKENKDLTDAEQRLGTAREQLKASVKTRIQNIDPKLAQLDSRTDPVSKKLATDLRIRRDTVLERTNAVDSIAITSWDGYQTEVEEQLKILENDLDKSLLDTEKQDARPPISEPIQ